MITIFKSFWANLDGEAWLRFLIAIAGLGLAFAAAVFSSAARESGNMLATAIFASSALFLAAVVGLTTVPYLARRVAATRVREAALRVDPRGHGVPGNGASDWHCRPEHGQ